MTFTCSNMNRLKPKNFETLFLERIDNESYNNASTSSGYALNTSSPPGTFEFSITNACPNYTNEPDNTQGVFLDLDMNSSLGLSLRSLGIDSTSYESIRNLHTNSYMMSKKNDIIDSVNKPFIKSH